MGSRVSRTQPSEIQRLIEDSNSMPSAIRAADQRQTADAVAAASDNTTKPPSRIKRLRESYRALRRRHDISRDFDWSRAPFMRHFLWIALFFFPICCAANVAAFTVVLVFLSRDFGSLDIVPSFTRSPHFTSFCIAILWLFAAPFGQMLLVYRPLYGLLQRRANDNDAATTVQQETKTESNPPWILGAAPNVDVFPDFISVRRRLWGTAALCTLGSSVLLCAIAIVGPEKLGFAGLLFVINMHKEVRFYAAQLQRSVESDFFEIVSGCLCSILLWFLLGLDLSYRWFCVARSLVRSRSYSPILISILFNGSIAAAYLLTISFALNATENEGPPLASIRQLCFVNSCHRTIWINQIGGSTGIACSSSCPRGTTCNPGSVDARGETECYFDLSLEPNFPLRPGEEYCMPFEFDPVLTVDPKTHMEDLVQWSGSIYASGGCDENGRNCETAICNDCPSYRGPIGPVTQAEMTLQVRAPDYYDITIINGANFPLSISPIPDPRFPMAPGIPGVPPQYNCGAPGSTKRLESGQMPASWIFTQPPPFPDGEINDAPTTYALVMGGSGSPCPCNPGETCGLRMMLTNADLPQNNISGPLCGELVGIWTDDEICGWTNAISYGWCRMPVPGMNGPTIEEMFQCTGYPYETSCFQQTTRGMSACCGCSVWPSLDIAFSMPCQGSNPQWNLYAMPRLRFLKEACPTCYTYPFDDSTSTFTCRSNTTINMNSYKLEWCPNGVEIQYRS